MSWTTIRNVSTALSILVLLSCTHSTPTRIPPRKIAESRTILLQQMICDSLNPNSHIEIVKNVLEERGYSVHISPVPLDTCCVDRSVKRGDTWTCADAAAGEYKNYDIWCLYELNHDRLRQEDIEKKPFNRVGVSGIVEFQHPYVYHIDAYEVNVQVIDSAADRVLLSAKGYGDSGRCFVRFKSDHNWDPRNAKRSGTKYKIKGKRYHTCENKGEQPLRMALEAALTGW